VHKKCVKRKKGKGEKGKNHSFFVRETIMSSPNEFQNDSLDAVLGGKGKISGDDRLRHSVLAGTLGVIRRRRRLKRCAVAATLLGCYLAGMVTVVFWRYGGEDLPRTSTRQIAKDNTTHQSTKVAPAPLLPDLAGPPDQKAVYAPQSQFEVLRRAGDRYLQDPEKMQLAIRTYARALKYASADERVMSPEHDTWLLMALKDAKSKEKKHENSQL
jgi:hypothetical protein